MIGKNGRDYTIPLDKVVKVLVISVALFFTGLSMYFAAEVHTLTSTNAELVDLLDTQLNVTQARMSRLEAIQRESIEWLSGEGPQAYVELLRAEADK